MDCAYERCSDVVCSDVVCTNTDHQCRKSKISYIFSKTIFIIAKYGLVMLQKTIEINKMELIQ